MGTILRRTNDDVILLVEEDINDFMSDKQEFYVINGGWSGIYENGAYTRLDCTSVNQFVDVVVYRHIEIDDFDDVIIENFKKKLAINNQVNYVQSC